MVSACTLLGNIYSEENNPEKAYEYYKKALESLDENVDKTVLAELFFKFGLANDDKGEFNTAIEYYKKCISIKSDNSYKALAYSNIAECYLDLGNKDEALKFFKEAYNIEKKNNNYDGICYTSSEIAEILIINKPSKALTFLKEAKKSAEFLNKSSYIIESSVKLGDYYYNLPDKLDLCLKEYLTALRTAINSAESIDLSKIEKRIQDMKLRMDKSKFKDIEKKYGR